MLRPTSFPSTIRPPEMPTSRLLPRTEDGVQPASGTPSVLDLMVEKAGEVNEMQQNADSMINQLLTGGNVSSAEVLTAVQKADMAFRTMLQVRNKLIEAYREVLQIQV